MKKQKKKNIRKKKERKRNNFFLKNKRRKKMSAMKNNKMYSFLRGQILSLCPENMRMTVNEGISNKIKWTDEEERKKSKAATAAAAASSSSSTRIALKAKRLLLWLFDLNYWSRHCSMKACVCEYLSRPFCLKIYGVNGVCFFVCCCCCFFLPLIFCMVLFCSWRTIVLHMLLIESGNKEESQQDRSRKHDKEK